MADKDVQILITAQDKATDALKRITSELSQLNSKMGGVQQTARQTAESMSKLATVGAKVQNVFGRFGQFGMNAVYFSAMGAAIGTVSMAFEEGISTLVGYNARMQDTQIAFKTMIGDAGAAKVYIDMMKDFAAKTPFEFKSVEQASNKMMAYGWKVKDIIPDLTAIGNAASALNVGEEGINRMILALGQLSLKSRANAQDLRQLEEVGVDALGYLAKKFNLTADAFDDLSKTGISGAEAMRAVLEGMANDPKFADMMAQKSKTMTGLWSTLKDNMSEIMGKIGEGMSTQIGGALTRITETTQKFVEDMREGGISMAFQNILPPDVFNLLERLSNTFSRVWNDVVQLGGATSTILIPAFGGAIDVGDKLINGVLTVLEPAIQGISNNMDAFQATITGVTGAFAAYQLVINAATIEVWLYVTAVDAAAIATRAFGVAVQFFTGPVGWAITALGLLIGAIMHYNNTHPKTIEGTNTIADRFNYMANRADDAADKINKLNAAKRIAAMTPAELKKASGVGGEFEDFISRQQIADKHRAEQVLNTAGGRAYTPAPGIEKTPKGGSAGKSAFETQTDKMEELLSNLQAKISDVIDTKPTAELAKLEKQLTKWRNDVSDAAKEGVDTSAVQQALERYATVYKEKINKDLKQAQAEFEAETALLVAKSSEDKILISQKETEQKKIQLEKQVDDWRKAGMTEIEISERKKAIIVQLAKDEADAVRESHSKDLERAYKHNENLIQLEGRTAEEVMNLNRSVIEEQIEMYRKVANDATLSAEKRAEAEEKLAGKIKQLNNQNRFNIGTAYKEATKEIKSKMVDVASTIVSTYEDMNSTLEDNFTKMLSGQQGFAESMKNIWSDLTTQLLSMMAKIIYYQMVYKPFQSFFTNMIGGLFGGGGSFSFGGGIGKHANGGVARGWSIVGEHGPELVNFSDYGRVYTADQTRSMLTSGTQTPVTVNVINQSGQQVGVAKQETKFNGVETVVNLWLEGYANNVNGMRTVLGGR